MGLRIAWESVYVYVYVCVYMYIYKDPDLGIGFAYSVGERFGIVLDVSFCGQLEHPLVVDLRGTCMCVCVYVYIYIYTCMDKLSIHWLLTCVVHACVCVYIYFIYIYIYICVHVWTS
jgi:hypothetical protein